MNRLKRIFKKKTSSVCSTPTTDSSTSYNSSECSLDRSQFTCRPCTAMSLPSSIQFSETSVFPRPMASFSSEFLLDDDPLNDALQWDIPLEFDEELILDDNIFNTATTATKNSTVRCRGRRKRLSILEPDKTSVKIFNEEDDTMTLTRRPQRRSESTNTQPRSILKKNILSHIYEEIGEDYGAPVPDIRPEVPQRPLVTPLKLFPPYSGFQPRAMELQQMKGYPDQLRRKKLPSFHRRQSWTGGF